MAGGSLTLGCKRLLLTVLMPVVMGCAGEDPLPALSNSVAHPLDQSRLEPARPRGKIVNVAHRSTTLLVVDAGGHRYPSLHGDDDGPMVGFVADFALTTDPESIVVLDGQANQITAYYPNGDSTLVGRQGRGPGEYLAARALDTTDEGEILVADEAVKIMTFGLGTMTAARYRGEIDIDVVPSDMCVLSDSRIAVLGVSLDGRSEALHLFDREGNSVWSSLIPYATDNQLLRMYMSEGRLVCGPDGIFVAFARLGEVMRVDLDGNLAWISEILGYRPVMTLTLNDDRQSVVTGAFDGSSSVHRIAGMHLVNDDHLLLQTQVMTVRDGMEVPEAFQSYVIDTATGSGHELADMPDRRIGDLGEGVGTWFSVWPPDFGFFSYEVVTANIAGG